MATSASLVRHLTGSRPKPIFGPSPADIRRESLRPVAQQEARAWTAARGAIRWIVEPALGKRQASATDAAVQQLAGLEQKVDPILQLAADAPADRLPVAARRRAALRQRRQLGFDLGEAQPKALGDL